MPTVILTTPGSRISLVSERLRVELPEPAAGAGPPQPARDVPLHDVEHIIADERVSLSTPALCECLRRAIPVVFIDGGHRVIGLAQAPAPHARVRQLQHARSADLGFALAIAASTVEAKIHNSRRLLQRVAANRDLNPAAAEIDALEHLRRQCLDAQSIDSLRGYEGAAAARYFDAYARFFPPGCPFPGRSRRPPLDPPNAILSLAYTLITAECEALLHASGLDPALGFLHTPEDRRPSLALDLAEPFRAPIADALALDALGHAVLQPREHFERRDGGCLLNLDGRRRFYTAYERRLEREFTSEHHGARTSLRGEMRRQVQSLKRALMDNEPLEPFLMN